MSEAVASPQHYVQGHIEAIYVIEQVLGKDGFKQFCMGNYLKYKMRHEHKSGPEDLAKAQVYLDWGTNGLPAPVNNRVPKKGEINKDLVTDTISELLEEFIQLTLSEKWEVKQVTRAVVNGRLTINAHVRNAAGRVYRIGIAGVDPNASTVAIVEDLVADLKKQHFAK